MHLPREITDEIVAEIEDTASLRAFCLVTPSFVCSSQARIFRGLQIRVDGPSPIDHRPMSPWQAESLFSSSPHLASYVQRLWIHIPTRPTEWYSPLQAVLPAFIRVREFIISASGAETRWTVLPEALKDAMQAVMLLPSLKQLELAYLSVPATLITSMAATIPELSLISVVVEDIEMQSSPMDLSKRALGVLTLVSISTSMVEFLATPGRLPSRRLVIAYHTEWADISKILQGTAVTLTQLHLDFHHRLHVGPPRYYLNALRVLELDTSAGPAPHRVPDDTLFALLHQIPTAMPHLEHLAIRVTIVPSLPRPGEAVWVRGAPLDMGSVATVDWRLCFNDHSQFAGFDDAEIGRELQDYEMVFDEFVHCMGEQMPVLRDSGGLSFSRIPLH
ncbi:hypothetical protein MVEN_00953000 [Mycena venus]|uniref:Uncharacterized protein n=1 Tax=Mycena venus TaxID=2733690 RepID=A0A8H7D223_9AGAR|nr:hypothetical protein MVEN_00953000 [Mycena venus]